MKRKNFWILISMLIMAAVLVTACSGGGKTTITVGSKDFTEQYIIGEMYALVLEDAGFTVERKLSLGGCRNSTDLLI